MPECVNLKGAVGQTYRVRFEESYYAERGADARADDPWSQIIPGVRGHVFPRGADRLAASSSTSGPTAR